MAARDALADPGVLGPEPVIEFGGSQAVALRGGLAVLDLRGERLRAQAAGLPTAEADRPLPAAAFAQAVVHVGKGRAALEQDVADAWACLAGGGRLLLCGDNAVGVVSAIDHVAAACGASATILANRGRGRIAALPRSPRPPFAPAPRRVPLAPPAIAAAFAGAVDLRVDPGVFSGDALDEGTASLLTEMAAVDSAPGRVLDLGCGAGHLGIAALRRWPAARGDLADASLRAVRCAGRNLADLGCSGRAAVHWWDAYEPSPAAGCDLVLINPPFHAGVAVDYGPAKAMFRAAAAASGAGSRWLVVANRRLPYEDELRRFGALRTASERGGFKVLEVRRG